MDMGSILILSEWSYLKNRAGKASHRSIVCLAMLKTFCHSFVSVLVIALAQTAHSQSASGSIVTTFAAGTQPVSSLIQASDGNFYGVTNAGGANGDGSVYELTSTGTLTTQYSFTNASDGAAPAAGLVQRADGALYGTTTLGGANNLGTVFTLTSTGLTTLHSFDPAADGNSPYAALIPASDGNLYGLLSQGSYNSTTGDYAGGTIFAITPTGVYENLFTFAEDGSQGSFPLGRLLQASDGNFWGTTSQAAAHGYGTVFFWNATNGLTTVHSFTEAEGSPVYGLAEASGSVYGITYPALSGYGEIFSVNLSTQAFQDVYAFTGGVTDGGPPASALLPYSDGYFYGVTQSGGANGSGTFFRVNTNGSPVTLYNFPSETINTFTDATLLEAQNRGIYFPLLEDATAGLSPSQMDGAGQIVFFSPDSTPPPSPVNLTAVSATVTPGGQAQLKWNLPNGAALSDQQCFAFSNPATSWSGAQAASGTVSVTLPNPGAYTFSLTCGGRNTSLISVSALWPANVTLAAPAKVAYGSTATLTATIATTGNATGTVKFVVNGTLLLATVPVSNGKASVTASTKGVPAGTYSVQAIYSGDASHATGSSPKQNVALVAGTTTTTLSATPQSVVEGAPVTLKATVTASAGTPTGSVTFLTGTFQIAKVNLVNGVASFTASSAGVPPATYPVRAVYFGSPFFASSNSANVPVTVTAHE
jgi:uncharacterized repeat protein (TIGR03803 family)